MNRHALLIAINEYPKLSASFQLQGCVNDAALVSTLLTSRFGFQDTEVASLINRDATREGILQALDRLAGTRQFTGQSPLVEGDLVVIAYSGHGSRVKDLEGDEADGFDSTLVPSDSDRPTPRGGGGPNLDITDDVLFSYFELIRQRIGKTGHLVLWFDCCHSGTIARDIGDSPARELPTDERDIEPLPILEVSRGDAPTEKGRSGWRRLNDGYVLLAGCADDEKSREYYRAESNDFCGAMTYHLVQEILQRSGKVTYYDVFEPARKAVALRDPNQHPQLEGDDERLLFEVERLDVPPFVPVVARLDDQTLLLAIGAVQGATVGSEYAIYPAMLADETEVGRVTLTEVGALESRARAENALPDSVVATCRAVETRHALNSQTLAVAVEGVGSGLPLLRSQIQSSSLLRLAKDEPADIAAVCHPPRTDADLESARQKGDPIFAPEAGALPKPSWLLVGRDYGLLPTYIHPASDLGVIEITVRNLEKWAKYRNVQALRPSGQDPLRPLITTQFGAVVEGNDTAIDPLPLHERTGLPLVELGKQVRLAITHHHPTRLFIAVLGLDVMGAITPIYPYDHRTREPLEPAIPLTIDFVPELPSHFPSQLEGGRETLKIMVTLQLVDFDVLGQEATKNTHPAIAQLGAATRGGGDSEAVPVQPETITDETWTTLSVDYFIHNTPFSF